MISVLVYGRNDARGYGMHKRVAISLNTIAEVLSAPTSEIIFVDYNTPNHLPTLPELIRDMLTRKARMRTRVLRVRPSVHARFAPFTPLPVLEPIARNIGLRRSRPQNPWILSTNTDSILAPPSGQSLCEIVSGLEGAHYGVPRFELPERMWEALDRLDPGGTINTVAGWGLKARLNEVVRGQGVVQFDNPGDFQLVRRSALFAIDGFDEEALLGWHVDQNLTHRLTLKHGAEGSLADKVKLYHCSHARQATATHSHDRIENDVQRFVHQVREPAILRQRDRWGCIDDHVGEFDLRQPTTLALLDAIEGAVSPLQGPPLEASYSSQSFDSLLYDAGHVGVYLLDLLSTFPRGVTIGYAGCRRDLLDILAAGLITLGFTEWLVVSADSAERLGVSDGEGVRVWPAADFIARTDLLVFEFGLARDEAGLRRPADAAIAWTEEEKAALDRVVESFLLAVEHERTADPDTHVERMLVAVNAINNRFEEIVASGLASTPTPFTTRLRYGAATRPAALEGGAMKSPSQAARSADASAARGLLTALLSGGFDSPAVRLVLASHARTIRDLIDRSALPPGVTPQDAHARLAIVQALPPEHMRLPMLQPGGLLDDASLSHPARLRDFENPDWLAAARRVAPSTARGKIRRDAWMWERAQLVRGLTSLFANASCERALLVAENPDDIVPALADMFPRLDVIDVRALGGDAQPLMLRTGDFTNGPHLFGEKLRAITPAVLASEAYDAIIIPHNASFRVGIGGLGPLLSQLRPHLKAGGILAIAGEIAMTGARRADRPDWNAAGPSGFPHALSAHAGLNLVAGNFVGIEVEDAALIGEPADIDAALPALAVRRDGEIFWPATWFFEAGPAVAVHSQVDVQLASLLLGDQIGAVSLAGRARRTDQKIMAGGDGAAGHVFFGPYLRLAEGAYLARVVVAPTISPNLPGSPNLSGPIKLVAEAAAGPDILVQQEVVLEPGSWDRPVLFELAFEICPEWSIRGAVRPCEIRLWSNGNAAFEVSEIALQRSL